MENTEMNTRGPRASRELETREKTEASKTVASTPAFA